MLYRARFPGHKVALRSDTQREVFASPGWAHEAQLLDQPLGVVALDEGGDRPPDLVEVLEDASVDRLLLPGRPTTRRRSPPSA